MNRLEKHFRVRILAEQIRQIQADLIVLQDDIPTMGSSGLCLAGAHLAKAAETLEHTPVLDLETQLHLSIANVEEKKRCQQVGGILPFERGNKNG